MIRWPVGELVAARRTELCADSAGTLRRLGRNFAPTRQELCADWAGTLRRLGSDGRGLGAEAELSTMVVQRLDREDHQRHPDQCESGPAQRGHRLVEQEHPQQELEGGREGLK